MDSDRFVRTHRGCPLRLGGAFSVGPLLLDDQRIPGFFLRFSLNFVPRGWQRPYPPKATNSCTKVDLLDVGTWLNDAGTNNIGSPYLHGDANLDGAVDVTDFGIWSSARFSATPEWCSGDFNADGFVDALTLEPGGTRDRPR